MKIIKHSMNFILAEFLNKGLIFLSLPFITRLVTPEQYGTISIFITAVSILSVFFCLNVSTSVGRRFLECKDEKDIYLGSVLIFSVIFNAILFFVFLIFRYEVASILNIEIKITFYLLLSSFFLSYYQIFLAYLHATRNSLNYATISVLRNVAFLSLALVWMSSIENDRHYVYIYSFCIVSFLCFAISVCGLSRKSKFSQFSLGCVKESIAYSLPLLPHVIAGFFLAQFDRVMINSFDGAVATGLYSFAYNVAMVMNVFILALNKAWVPYLFRYIEQNKIELISNYTNLITKIVCCVCALFMVFSGELVVLFADEQYTEAVRLIPIIVIGFLFVYIYTVYVNFSFYHKKTAIISVFTMLAALVNVVLNYFTIPRFGYEAAAYTTVLSYMILLLFHYVNVRFFLNVATISLSKLLVSVVQVFLVFSPLFFYNIFYHDSSLLGKLFLSFVTSLVVFGRFFLRFSRSRFVN